MSKVPYVEDFLDEPEYSEERLRYTTIHLNELKRRRDSGDKNIHFLDGLSLYGNDPSECAVDGCHSTDLGFYMLSGKMAPVIERILTK